MPVAQPIFNDVDPDKVQISMLVRNSQDAITEWLDYSFNDNYLTPVSGFNFTVGGLTRRAIREKFGITAGVRVSLQLGAHYVGDGYIDDIEIDADRSSGIIAKFEGRDRLGYTVDSNAPPKKAFKEGVTLEEALKQILGPFGFTKFELDSSRNQGLKQGLVSGVPLSKGGKKKGPKPLASFVLHQTKPYPGEGAFAFASRIAQAHGVWLRLSADGETIIAAVPDYDRPPSHQLRRTLDGGTNVLGGSVKFSCGEQPALIIADGSGGGGEFGNSRLRAKAANPAVFTTDPEIERLWTEYKDAAVVTFGAVGEPFVVDKCRVVYHHDQSANTPKQLENSVKKQMSLFLRKSLQATYTAVGHGQMVNGVFVPFAVDTMVHVIDEVAELDEVLWVVGCTFTRSRSDGTKTRLELVRAHSLDLGESDAEKSSNKPSTPKQRRPRSQLEEQLTSIDTAKRAR